MTFKKGDIARFYMDTHFRIGFYFLILEKPVCVCNYCSFCNTRKMKTHCVYLGKGASIMEIYLCKCFKLLGEKK